MGGALPGSAEHVQARSAGAQEACLPSLLHGLGSYSLFFVRAVSSSYPPGAVSPGLPRTRTEGVPVNGAAMGVVGDRCPQVTLGN